jgi:hypothetical protein
VKVQERHPATRIATATAVGLIAAGLVAGLLYGVKVPHVWPAATVAFGLGALFNLMSTRPRADT